MSTYHPETQYKQDCFSNGLRVVYQSSPTNIPLTSIQIFCNVGSAFEIDNHRGMAHMVEHMVFKGTKTYTPQKIFQSFDKIGAEFNAYTTKRVTCYTIKCDSCFVETCIPMIADMLFHSTFPNHEYIKEKEVVKEENIRDQNDVSRMNYQEFCNIAYDGTSFIHPVDTLEYHDTKHAWTLKEVIHWYKHYYIPSNMLVSIVSTLSWKQVKKLLSNSDFSSPDNRKGIQYNASHVPGLRFPQQHLALKFGKGETRIVCKTKKGMTNTHLMIGFPCSGYHDTHYHKLTLLANILNGMSGRLFMQLREKTPLTYRSFVETEYEEYGGYFAVVVECSNENVFLYKQSGKPSKPGVLPIVIELLQALQKKGVTSKELTFAKNQIKHETMQQFEDIDSFCDHNGRFALIYDTSVVEFVSFDRLYETYYKTITLRQMNDYIRDVFVKEHMIITLLSNDPPSLKKVQKYL
tara:strand:+ start:552 stop:1937 length:1386 start_codon:yes stop_codon:yes gene_type:complete